MTEPPALDDEVVRGLIKRLGGTPPEPPDPNLVAAEALANELAEQAAAEKDAEALDPIAQLAAAADLGIPWAKMKDTLSTVMLSVANGTVRATAAQVSMLKYIVEKAQEDLKGDDAVLGVVLLPTLGGGPTLQLDPEQRRKAEAALNAEA